MDEGAKGNAGGTLGEPGLGVVVPCGAGNVQVNPRGVAGKFFDEHGSDGRTATFAATDILDVRDRAFDEFAVLVVYRQLPHFLASHFRASQQLVRKRLIRTEYPDIDAREGHDDCAR